MVAKVNGGSTQPVQQPVTPVHKPAHSLPAGTEHGQSSQFQGSLFQHGGTGTPMRRGPTLRMPLRSPQAKQRASARSASGASQAGNDDTDLALPQEGEAGKQGKLSPIQVNFQARGEGDGQFGGQQQDEKKRFDNLFSVASLRSGSFAASVNDVDKARKGLSTPLPPMNSLPEVVRFIHGALESDPSGKSLSIVLRSINAAILRNEIKLPATTKVAEMRDLLIETFGKGHQNKEVLSPSVSAVLVMLPLWLVNLSRRRTESGKKLAAARLLTPRAALTTE